jgi:hypothetical protein
MKIDPARTHEVEWSATARASASPSEPRDENAQLVVKIDGVTAGTWRGSRAVQLSAGTSVSDEIAHAEIAPKFEGIVHSSQFFKGERVTEFGAVRMRLVFPADKPGAREPLVVTGEPGRGDQFFVEYGDGPRVRFGVEHWGKPPFWSSYVDIIPGEPQVIEVAFNSFPRGSTAIPSDTQPVRVRLNGRHLWAVETKLFPVEAKDVFIGRNPIGGTACGPTFTGSVLGVEFTDGGGPGTR